MSGVCAIPGEGRAEGRQVELRLTQDAQVLNEVLGQAVQHSFPLSAVAWASQADVVHHRIEGPDADAHGTRPSAVFMAARDRDRWKHEHGVPGVYLAGDDGGDGRVRDQR